MQLTIQSMQGPYPVIFIRGINALIEEITKCPAKSACVIDANIIKHHPALYEALVDKMPVFVLTATEQNKTPESVLSLLTFMQQHGLNKKSNLFVIGGGIVQDVATLSAQLYHRGIPFTLIPTTLLGMADSCIGAKSSINFNGYKNQLGSFYSPNQIYICSEFLNSLDQEAIFSGLGEIFKFFIVAKRVADLSLSEIKQSNLLNLHLIEHTIFEGLKIKQRFIEEDEFDKGNRRILNYGHTFGHAIEALSNYAVPHGLAIVLGMDIVNFIAMELGMLSPDRFAELHKKIIDFYDWRVFNFQYTASDFLATIRQDKKSQDNQINFVLLTTSGDLCLKLMAIDHKLEEMLIKYFNGHFIICLPYARDVGSELIDGNFER